MPAHNTDRALTRFDDLPEKARKDTMGPPDKAVQVRCLHCDHVFSSDSMVWYGGLWRCPRITCGGAGFLFDIYPTASVFFKEDAESGETDEWGITVFKTDEDWEEDEDDFGEIVGL